MKKGWRNWRWWGTSYNYLSAHLSRQAVTLSMNKHTSKPRSKTSQKFNSNDCDVNYRSGTTVTFDALLEVFAEMLVSRSESVVADALKKLPVAIAGLRVVRGEPGLTALRSEGSVTQAQCTALAIYILNFKACLPDMSAAERFEVLSRRRAQQCMLGKSTLRTKRRWIRLFCRLLAGAQQWQCRTGEQLRSQQIVLSFLLHEPLVRIEKLWREHVFWFYFNYARRLLHLENRPESARYLESFHWPEQNDYYRVTNKSDASRVLLSIHMGDFFGAFRMVSALSTQGRQVISLRRDVPGNHGMQDFSADRVSHRVFFHRQHPSTAIVSALRGGRHTLATLFDLRGDFGSTVSVDFFGRSARFVKGPAQLAIMGRCPIFVFVCHEHRGRNCIEMAPVIDTRLQPGESLHQATVRITQVLVKLAENWIRRWPAQWKYLTALPGYFEAGA